MAFLTSAEVKSFLRISDTTYDTLIASLIPTVRAQVVYSICKNAFTNNNKIYLLSSTISFTASGLKISDSASMFVESDFVAGDDIIVQGSLRNDGLYEIKTVTANEIVLENTNDGATLVSESAGETIRIVKVYYPKELKIASSQLINFYLTHGVGTVGNIVSESTGSHSVSYSDSQISKLGIPKHIETLFTRWKKLSWAE